MSTQRIAVHILDVSLFSMCASNDTEQNINFETELRSNSRAIFHNIDDVTPDSTTSRLSSSRQFTIEELAQPWPEYKAIYRDKPERLAAVARQLFVTGDDRFLSFLYSLPWEVDHYIGV